MGYVGEFGWIKMHRKIRDWRDWPAVEGRRFTKCEAWIDLLMRANHADRIIRSIQVNRGQILTSQVKLANYWKWDRGTVSRFLKDLEKFNEIATGCAAGCFTIITICNYEIYQGEEGGESDPIPQVMPHRIPQVMPHLMPHKQELKNYKNYKKKKRGVSLEESNPDHQQTIQYWSDKYFERYGIKYVFKGGKDGAAIKRLLKAWGVDGLRRLIDQLFISTDQFYETGGGRTIGVLSSCDNKLAQEVIAPVRSKIPQRIADNLQASVAWLKNQEADDEGDGQRRLRQETE